MTQKISKVRKVTVVTEDGTEHTFEGVEGHANVRSQNYRGIGRKNQPYQQALQVHLTLPMQGDIK